MERKGDMMNGIGRMTVMVTTFLSCSSLVSACGWGCGCVGTVNGIYCAGLFSSLISSMASEEQYWHFIPAFGRVILQQLKHQCCIS